MQTQYMNKKDSSNGKGISHKISAIKIEAIKITYQKTRIQRAQDFCRFIQDQKTNSSYLAFVSDTKNEMTQKG